MTTQAQIIQSILRSKCFQLDQLFQFACHQLKKNQHHDLIQQIRRYEKDLHNTEVIDPEKALMYVQTGQYLRETFSYEFPFAGMPNTFYRIEWDIPTAQEIVERNSRKIKEMPVQDLINGANVDVTWSKVNKIGYPIQKPIIVVDYPVWRMQITIDGNHRLAKAYQENPRGTIPAYKLTEEESFQSMTSDLFRKLYKIHCNIVAIIAYSNGLIDELDIPYDL
ncbi:Uncharacterised protein [Mycobacterium tuberculosis]|nr:Uncharacterised protein [Mycobacterium tuberculosis]